MTDPTQPGATGARAALTQAIAVEVGHERAAAIVSDKARHTKTAVFLAALTVLLATLSYLLAMKPLVTLAIVGGGMLWAGQSYDGEYLMAALKDLSSGVADAIRKIRDAIKGTAP